MSRHADTCTSCKAITTSAAFQRGRDAARRAAGLPLADDLGPDAKAGRDGYER